MALQVGLTVDLGPLSRGPCRGMKEQLLFRTACSDEMPFWSICLSADPLLYVLLFMHQSRWHKQKFTSGNESIKLPPYCQADVVMGCIR